MRKIGEVALTQSERNKRFYWNHKKEEIARSAQYYRDNKEAQRLRHRNTRHHITQDWFDNKMVEQDHKCAICQKAFEKTPHIDHDHNCCPPLKSCDKCRRDLLCERCNVMIGMSCESEIILVRAIQYVRKHKENQ